MDTKKKRLLSGVKPTGRPHLGNYFGAMRQFVDLQESYEAFIFIPNYHAITTMQDRDTLIQLSKDMLLDYLAIGLDPEKTVFYIQSDVPEHTELTWIFNCITTMPYLMRAHAFKDAEAKDKEVTVGTFDYPLLMAADILLYSPEVVPVGKDQKQHIEIARDTAEKFNRIFGETFVLPEAHILEYVATVPGTDGQKMSKSYGNTISLFASDDEIKKAVMSIVTDSKQPEEPKDPDTDTIFALHRLFSTQQLKELEEGYRSGGLSYRESKEILAENICAFTAPLRERRITYAQDHATLQEILDHGRSIAGSIAKSKMDEVRDKVGVKVQFT